jgi:hypothetical protein
LFWFFEYTGVLCYAEFEGKEQLGIRLTYLRSFYWRKSLIYGFRLILTQKFPLKSMV